MKIGILGAGQLARMMILNSKYLGIDFVLFCPEITATTRDLAQHVLGDFTNQQALQEFCAQVDVVTFESENISDAALEFILQHKEIFPPKPALLATQDRLLEKQLFNELDIATNNYMAIESYADVLAAAEKFGLPLILKSRRFGYDGKNQYHIKTDEQLKELESADFTNFIAESFVAFSHEVSVIGARAAQGQVVIYDLCHNHHEAGILRETKNQVADPLLESASNYLTKVMQHFNYVGVLTIEFFVQDGKLLANEMAPRVHNSGHWTIEGCAVSQFENHVRAIAGLPLGNTASNHGCKMVNCISEMPTLQQVLQQGGHYHDYQKQPRVNRKLGHITFIE